VHLAETLVALGGSFLAAALLARLGRRIELPTIPLFMLAGILFGPHTPGIVLVSEPSDFALLASLGLIFLLFYLGLEFHLDDLVGGGGRLLLVGGAYIVLNVGGGLVFGLALGWGSDEAMVVAGVVGISSSAIVTKVLVELGRLANPESRLILGIIVVEDIFLALYLALLQPIFGAADGFWDAAGQVGVAFAFLLALFAVARWGAKPVGKLVALKDDELLVVTFVGLAILTAGIAEELGVSDAIGAFMIGLVLGNTKSAPRIRKLVHPLRDAFAAVFFFSFGLSIDPGDVRSVTVPITVAVLVTVVLNLLAGVVAARVYRLDRFGALNIGLTVLSRGEFALVLAALAASAGLDERIAPFTAGYVLVLAIIGPLAATHSARIGRLLPSRAGGSQVESQPRA
jgi:CPA2 family monovalent cation:H+ antiporter-2